MFFIQLGTFHEILSLQYLISHGRVILCNVHVAEVVCFQKNFMILCVRLTHGNALAVVSCLTQPFLLTEHVAITLI